MSSKITPVYKFVYFNLRALGEPIRYLLHYMEIPFEDSRIDPADWPNVKNNYKWRQVPELHVTHNHQDKSYCLTQTAAICRYLANSYPTFGLMPLDPMQVARCDAVVDVVQDMRIQIKPYIVIKYFDPASGPAKVAQTLTQIFAENFPLYLGNLEEMLKEEKGPFICGEEVKWADFFLANFTSTWEQILEDTTEGEKLLETYSSIKNQIKAVEALPKIQEWIEKRPKTIF